MTSLAFVFPGQGSQSVGMGRDLAASSPAASAVWAAADAALGEPISTLAWDGPAERLDLTENAQPALLAASIAILEVLRERWAAAGVPEPRPAFAAGHSMGQYSAFVAAGVLSLGDGVRLVRRRGELMQASGQGRDGAMAALIGLDDARLPELIAEAGKHGTFVVANRNAPGQVVVSGERAAIEVGAEIAKTLGAKRAIVLPVSVAAHSPLMADAADGMRETLAGIAFADPTTPLLANRNAPGQVVVSGERAAIEAGAEIAKTLGAKRAIVLPVSVAAHSPLMAEAADGMRETLAGIAFADPTTTLLANADGRPITTGEQARAELVDHLTAGVDWVTAVQRMTAAGVTTFVEVGPGKVLTGLIKRIAPDAEIVSADDPASHDRLIDPAGVPA